MFLDLPDAPPTVSSLCADLLLSGYQVVGDRRGGMGGVEIVLRSPPPTPPGQVSAEVQIAADRGRWTVGLRFDEMSRFIDPRVWAAHIDGGDIGPPDVDLQTRFVATRLADAAQAVRTESDIEVKLMRRGEDHMRHHLGPDG